MGILLVTAPLTTAITVQQAKDQVQLKHGADDQLLLEMLEGATGYLEKIMARSFVETEWDLFLDNFPGLGRLFSASHINLPVAHNAAHRATQRNSRAIRPPRSNLLSVTHLKYFDVDGVEQTLVENTDFVVDIASAPGRVVEAVDKNWPSTQDRPNAVNLRFKAGYGDSDASVPADVQNLIKMLTAHYYENPMGWANEGVMMEVPMAVKAIKSAEKVYNFP